MTKLFDQAVDAVRRLPPAEQDDIARALLELAGLEVGAVPLSEEEREAITRSKAAATRGGFATDQEVRAVWGN